MLYVVESVALSNMEHLTVGKNNLGTDEESGIL